MKIKKGIIPALTVAGILALSLLAFVLFGGLALFTVILAQNAVRLAGIILLVFAGLSFTGVATFGITPKTRMVMFVLGSILVVLPIIGVGSNLTLGAIIP